MIITITEHIRDDSAASLSGGSATSDCGSSSPILLSTIVGSAFGGQTSVTDICSVCQSPCFDQWICLVDGKPFHPNCLKCSICDSQLGYETSCFVKNGLLLCRADYQEKYRRFCNKCRIPLEKDDVVMRARDAIFHVQCFSCCMCSIPLDTGDYFTMSDTYELYCQRPYCSPRASDLIIPLAQTSCAPDITQTSTSVAASVQSQLTPPIGLLADTCLPTSSHYIERLTPQPPPGLEDAHLQAHSVLSMCRPRKEESDEHDDLCDEEPQPHNRSKRMRTSFKHHQLRTMKQYFNLNHNPDAKDLKQLAQKTGLSKRVLQVWFQNARAKYRRSMQGRDAASISPSSLMPLDMLVDHRVPILPPLSQQPTTAGMPEYSTSPNETSSIQGIPPTSTQNPVVIVTTSSSLASL